jgi:hypothetical protein
VRKEKGEGERVRGEMGGTYAGRRASRRGRCRSLHALERGRGRGKEERAAVEARELQSKRVGVGRRLVARAGLRRGEVVVRCVRGEGSLGLCGWAMDGIG